MTLAATCTDCSDEHPVADRSAAIDETCHGTECPSCGSRRYTSTVTDRTVKSVEERITDAVSDVHGVGNATLEAIVAEFDSYAGLEDADTSRLEAIDGVGTKTAERIQDIVAD